jgi:hypothetical protein
MESPGAENIVGRNFLFIFSNVSMNETMCLKKIYSVEASQFFIDLRCKYAFMTETAESKMKSSEPSKEVNKSERAHSDPLTVEVLRKCPVKI